MAARGIVIPHGDDQWYMDEAAAEVFRQRRAVRIALFLALSVVAMLVVMLLSN